MVIEAARLAVIVEAQVAQAERDLQRFGVLLGSVATSVNGTAQKASQAADGVTRATRIMSRSARDAHRAGRDAAEGLTAVAAASVRAGTATEAVANRLRVATRSASDVHGAGRQASEGLTAVATAAERAAAGAKRAGDAAEDAGRKAKSGAQGFTIFGQSLDRIGSQLTSIGTRLSIGVTAPLTLAGRAVLKAGSDFESAFAGVRKTVDATESQFQMLRQGIRDMAKEIPATREEIAGVMEAAGQLGIATQHLLDFTRVAINMGVATTMSAEDAAFAMARFANIMQTPQDQFERLGAVVVHLGNNLAATESEIMNMALRIAGAGHVIGLTEEQVLGLAAGLSAVGIRAEMGGSAISRTMIEIANAVETGTEELELFAAVAGMTVPEFSRLFREDASQAIVAFIEGLGSARAEGENVFQLLDELGLAEIRVRDMLTRTAGAGDLLRRSQVLANDAMREGNALAEEAARRYETVESRLKTLRSRLSDVGVTLYEAFRPELVSLIDKAAGALDRLGDAVANADKGLIGFAIGFAGVAAAVGPVLGLIGGVVSVLGGPLAGGIAAATFAIGGLVGGFITLRTSLDEIEAQAPATAAAIREAMGAGSDWAATMGDAVPKIAAGFATAAQAVLGFVELARSVGDNLNSIATHFTMVGVAGNIAIRRLLQQSTEEQEANLARLRELAAEYDASAAKHVETGMTLLGSLGDTYDTLYQKLRDGSRALRLTADEGLARVGAWASEMESLEDVIERVSGEASAWLADLRQELTGFASAQTVIDKALGAAGGAIDHWNQKLEGAKRALEMLEEKRKRQGYLSEEEQRQYETLTWAVERYGNGIEDDLNQQYIAAQAAAAEFDRKLDELNQALADGKIDEEQYAEATAQLTAEAAKYLDKNRNLIASHDRLAETIQTLTDNLNDLMTALGLLPPETDMQINDNFEEARERLRDVDRQIAALPKSFTITGNVDISGIASGVAAAARLLPHSPAEEGPLSVEPNWDWLFQGIATAAERHTKEAVEKVRGYLDAIRSGFATFRESFSFSREFAVFSASGLALPDAAAISPLVGLSEAVAGAFTDSALAFAQGRPEEWSQTVRGFTDAASGGIRALNDLLKLLVDMEQSPGFANDEATRERISRLKFLTEHLAVSLGDTAAVIAATRPAGFVEQLREYSEAVTPGIRALTDMYALVSDLLDPDAPAIRDSDQLRDAISNLKHLTEHVAFSLGDTARFVAANRPAGFGEALRAFSEEVTPGIGAMVDMVGLIQALTDEATPATFDHAAFRDRLTALKRMIEQVALDMSEATAAMAQGRPDGFAAQVTEHMEAAKAAISAEAEALRLLHEMVEGTGFTIRPERLRERSQYLADTVVLIASDMSAATDRLVTEAPGIVENLKTFSEVVAPAMDGVTAAVDAFAGLAAMTRINRRQSDVFADNMSLTALAIRRGIEPLERMAEEGITARFQQLIMDIVNPLKVALTALGGSGSTAASAARPAAGGVGTVVRPSPELSSSPSRQIGGVPVSYGGGTPDRPTTDITANFYLDGDKLFEATFRRLYGRVRLGSGVHVG